MVTSRQLEANRSNARKSTGPKSKAGKEKARLNAITHGLSAKAILIGDEDPKEFEALRTGLHRDYAPQNTLQRHLVDHLAVLLWRRQRTHRAEAAAISNEISQLEERDRSEEDLLIARRAMQEFENQLFAERGETPPHRFDTEHEEQELTQASGQRRTEAALVRFAKSDTMLKVLRFGTAITNEIIRIMQLLDFVQVKYELRHGRVIEGVVDCKRTDL